MPVRSNSTHHWRRGATVLALLAGTILAVTACSPYYLNESSNPISESDVVGTWAAEDDDGHLSSLEFAADGSVVVAGLPQNPTADFRDVDWTGPIFDGNATWSISETDVSTWHVDLKLAGAWSPSLLAITTEEDGLQLVLPLGDPDMKTRVTFSRVE